MNHRAVMQQALEALRYRNGGSDMLERDRAAIEALRAALAEPEPEPVGHLHSNGDFCSHRSVTPSGDWPIPLYTTPPQRKPLTDGKVQWIIQEWKGERSSVGNFRQLVRAVERAHGIGGDE